MPAIPELGKIAGKEGMFKIAGQLNSEKTADPPHNISIATEVIVYPD